MYALEKYMTTIDKKNLQAPKTLQVSNKNFQFPRKPQASEKNPSFQQKLQVSEKTSSFNGLRTLTQYKFYIQ